MSSKLYFNPLSASRQAFNLPTDVLKFVIKGCSAKLWLKLLKSCKYFYAKNNRLIFKNTTLKKDGSIEVAERRVSSFWENVDEIPCDFFLIGKLTLSCSLTKFMPKMWKSELRELCISGTRISMKEFIILTAYDLLESFVIRDSNVLYENTIIVSLEDIFAFLPNVTSFTYEHTKWALTDKSINADTFRRMTETSRNRKLILIHLNGFLNLIANDFVSFVTNHAARNCKITLKNVSATTPGFKKVVDDMLAKWEPQSTKPSVLHIHNNLIQQMHMQVQNNHMLLAQAAQQLQQHIQHYQAQRQQFAHHQQQLERHLILYETAKRASALKRKL
uniref:F-box domain-containing protein n=1 Tax=Panagrolaimus sp. PS1159 TaxID=55785 RepID=A0AC35EY45_9BILA